MWEGEGGREGGGVRGREGGNEEGGGVEGEGEWREGEWRGREGEWREGEGVVKGRGVSQEQQFTRTVKCCVHGYPDQHLSSSTFTSVPSHLPSPHTIYLSPPTNIPHTCEGIH